MIDLAEILAWDLHTWSGASEIEIGAGWPYVVKHSDTLYSISTLFYHSVKITSEDMLVHDVLSESISGAAESQ